MWFGQYAVIMEEPKNEQEKESVIQSAIEELTEMLRKEIVNPDWSSVQHIVKEERNALPMLDDWYGESKPIPYLLTVAVKLKGESCAAISADDPSPTDGDLDRI